MQIDITGDFSDDVERERERNITASEGRRPSVKGGEERLCANLVMFGKGFFAVKSTESKVLHRILKQIANFSKSFSHKLPL